MYFCSESAAFDHEHSTNAEVPLVRRREWPKGALGGIITGKLQWEEIIMHSEFKITQF